MGKLKEIEAVVGDQLNRLRINLRGVSYDHGDDGDDMYELSRKEDKTDAFFFNIKSCIIQGINDIIKEKNSE